MLDTSSSKIDKLIPDSDIIIGGFPCQGFSRANLDRSMEDTRNYLYEELLKVISVKKPSYFILENVRGLESMEKGAILSMILDDLEKCGTITSKFFPTDGVGYGVYYGVHTALDFGVSQNRKRVIIIGIRNDISKDDSVYQFISDKVLERKIDPRNKFFVPGNYAKDSEIAFELKPHQIINNLYEGMITNKPYKIPYENGVKYRHKTLRDSIFDLPHDYTDEVLNHTGTTHMVALTLSMGDRATSWDEYAPIIMARSSGTGGPLIPPHPNQHRRLSIREVARIQTFPDKFFFFGPLSQTYKQIRNAITVLMAYNIASIFKN